MAVRSLVPGSVLLFELSDGCFEQHLEDLLSEEQLRHLTILLGPQSSFEVELRQSVQSIIESLFRDDGKVDIVVLASRLATSGNRVSIRTAVGGGSGQECFRNLHYEFLVVCPQHDDQGAGLIVDPKFREQFRLSQQTPRYSQLLEHLPCAFVGTQLRLANLVRLLSSEMEAAFCETGITMPPWRQTSSLMSKWKPMKSRDIVVTTPSMDSDKIDGVSPTGPMSYASSRTSSSCSNVSPERDRSLGLGRQDLSRKKSEPQKVQSGFAIQKKVIMKNEHICGRIPEHGPTYTAERPAAELCGFCALTLDHENRARKSEPKARLMTDQSSSRGYIGADESQHLGLLKVHTVKRSGYR